MIDNGRQTPQSPRWHCAVAPTAFVVKFTVVALVAALTFDLFVASLAAEAQPAGKVYRIAR